mmetsp:Transcript_36793/g.87189  ORF Transcript_36793/g.87189 Transcript_36793/m.87189 type:complete len:184 (-) Transcript_36793:47-598(-)
MDAVQRMVPDDPESLAVWLVRFTSIQFGICFFTSLTRTDNNGALALLGLYAAFGRRGEATKLYFIFLLLSCVTDFIWMIVYGNQIAGAELQEVQNDWEDYAFPPVGTAKFVLAMSVIQFIIKIVSVPFTYKLFSTLGPDLPPPSAGGARAFTSYSSAAPAANPTAGGGGDGGYQSAYRDRDEL